MKLVNQAAKFCKVNHFANDTNHLCLINYIRKLNKVVNAGLNANTISLSVKKLKW